MLLSDNDWDVITTKDEYIKMSSDEKSKFAETFFEKEIQPLAKDFKIDTPKLKEWFSEKAVFVKNRPIKEFSCPDHPDWIYYYRDIDTTGMPGPSLLGYLFDYGTILLSIVLTLLLLGVPIGIYKVIHWVYLGFKEKT